MRRLLALASAAVVALALAPGAALGVTRTTKDLQNRLIRFDVRSSNADIAGYTRILRRAIHGDEIRDVVIRIVPRRSVAVQCGSGDAVACYRASLRDALIVVPAGDAEDVEHSLLHEYGHHLDRQRRHRGLPEPNGTPRWWAARLMRQRLRAGEVAFDYSLGWTHSIGEIFAEDYVQLHVDGQHTIGWLPPPNAAVQRALRLDLTGRANGGPRPRPVVQPPAVPPPGPQPPTIPVTPPGDPGLVIDREGTIESEELRTLPFGLLGPDRRAQVTARATGAGTARLELICDGRVLDSAVIGDDRPAAFDRPGLGPAQCELMLTGLTGTLDYDIRLTLSIVAG